MRISSYLYPTLLAAGLGFAVTACGGGSDGFIAACRSACEFAERCREQDPTNCNATCDLSEEAIEASGQDVASECNDAGQAYADCLDGITGEACMDAQACNTEATEFNSACGGGAG